MPSAVTSPRRRPQITKRKSILRTLADIQIGGQKKSGTRIKKRDLVYILRNLSTLIENGLTLPRALETVTQERSLKKYTSMLSTIRHMVESGDTLSNALSQFGDTFSDVMINQIRVGERSGTLPETR